MYKFKIFEGGSQEACLEELTAWCNENADKIQIISHAAVGYYVQPYIDRYGFPRGNTCNVHISLFYREI